MRFDKKRGEAGNRLVHVTKQKTGLEKAEAGFGLSICDDMLVRGTVKATPGGGAASAQAISRTSTSHDSRVGYRDAVCGLCEKTVSLVLNVPLAGLQARNRCKADVALARQVAMYLCHTTFSLLMTEVGLHFRRDRTTVAHACALVEDKRDDFAFDVLICQLEALLNDARCAIEMQSELNHQCAPSTAGNESLLATRERVTA